MAQELIDAFDRSDADDAVKCVIVTGEGRAFCAGADLGRGAETWSEHERRMQADEAGSPYIGDGGGMLSLRIFHSQKPVIGAINGAAVGVGVTMTLPMDVRLASTSARFGFVFARRGIVPEAASSWFLPRVVGISQALEWTYSGRVFDADEALAGGLVRSVHQPDELIPAAHALAVDIAANTAPVSVALARQMMWRMLGQATPWRHTAPTAGRCSPAGAAPMPGKASRASWRSAKQCSPIASATAFLTSFRTGTSRNSPNAGCGYLQGLTSEIRYPKRQMSRSHRSCQRRRS
jgi:enoyl-CoA hydratase/carnithine racemase